MKKLKLIAVTAFLLFINCSVEAQENTPPKPLIIQTMYVTPATDAGMRVNVDSLLTIWKERVMKPNPYFVSTKILRHWWGHDSREVVFIFELKNWGDLEKAFDKQNGIIEEHKGWATKEDAQAFGKMWVSTFVLNSHHSDEIYRVVAE